MSGQIDRVAAIKRTGELMLSGWRLLGILCPICNTALLSKADNIRCPGCDLPVTTEAQQIGSTIVGAVAPPTPPEPNRYSTAIDIDSSREQLYNSMESWGDTGTAGEIGMGSNLISDAVVESKSDGGGSFSGNADFERMNKRLNDVSAVLGKKMLAGWCMLGEVCPRAGCKGTPLLLQPQSDSFASTQRKLCVACGTSFMSTASGELIDESSSATSGAADSARAPQSSGSQQKATDVSYYLNAHNAPMLEPSDDRQDQTHSSVVSAPDPSRDSSSAVWRSDRDDPSMKMAAYLLRGWAMLDSCCQSDTCKGNVPLMRDPSTKQVMNHFELPARRINRPQCNSNCDFDFTHVLLPTSILMWM